ncbi:MAG: isochorismate synthase [Geitlerinemataceae cyanobacterium]
MKFIEQTRKALRFFSEGAIRLFSPSDDSYPDVGVQPFEGYPSKKRSD